MRSTTRPSAARTPWPSGRTKSGLISASTSRSPRVCGHAARSDDGVDQRVHVALGRPRKPSSSGQDLSSRTIALGIAAADPAAAADRGVLEQLGRHAAHAEQDGRAELRVAVEAEDQLGAALDQSPAPGSLRAPCRCARRPRLPSRRSGCADLLRRHVDRTPPTSLLWAIVARQDLQHDRAAQLARPPARLRSRRGDRHLAGDGHAEAREQRLALRLVERVRSGRSVHGRAVAAAGAMSAGSGRHQRRACSIADERRGAALRRGEGRARRAGSAGERCPARRGLT